VKRILLIVAAAVAVALLAGTTAASAASGLHLVEAKGPTFPTRTYVLSLSNNVRLGIHDVKVTENGGPVAEESLIPASQASRKTFGAVLLLDTSYSMTGGPLKAALEAARAFVDQRNGNEQVGVIEFNQIVTPVLGMTSDASKIAAALAKRPKIRTGTHIFDAVAQAEAMLAAAHISSGSIVVLSDGADHHSTKTLPEVIKALRRGTKIYGIGLKDETYKPGTLEALATAGHGQYAEATPTKLASLFEALGQQLSNEYILQYKSLLGASKPVRVQVQVRGVAGAGLAGYRTPPLPVPRASVKGTYSPSIGNRIWGSAITMIVLALLGAGVVALLVIVALQPKRSGLPARMAEFVSIRDLQRDKGEPGGETAAGSSEEKNFWQRFEETLEIAEIHTTQDIIIAGTVVATALTFLLIYAGTGSPLWALFALAVPYFVREWVIRTLARRRNRFAEQLPDALQVIASALRSGHSLAGALAVVVESASEPMKSEMQHVVAAEQLGVPIQDSMMVVAKRMDSRDVEQLALVAELQREAGGNAAEVVDAVAETVRERFDLKRLIKTLTMQGRMSRWIVSALPIGIVLILQIENPHYLHPLLASTGGKIVFGLAAGWAVLGSYAIKKIVEIEV
jgi:Flp pilus assembly protein TadB/Mg-chelatase subunit ChlD